MQTALKYQKKSYCPYSKYKVGASVLTESGNIYGGFNIENASYSLTIDAEQCAIACAVSNGEKNLKAIAIAANGAKPCGACLQVMSEFMDKNSPILLIDTSKKGKITISAHKLKQLLPLTFSAKDID